MQLLSLRGLKYFWAQISAFEPFLVIFIHFLIKRNTCFSFNHCHNSFRVCYVISDCLVCHIKCLFQLYYPKLYRKSPKVGVFDQFYSIWVKFLVSVVQKPTPRSLHLSCIIDLYFQILKWVQPCSNYYWFSLLDQKREDYHEVRFWHFIISVHFGNHALNFNRPLFL